MLTNFLKALIAVVAGNLLYFFVLTPILPLRARHTIFQIDFGLIVDFWVCIVVFGIVDLLFRRVKSKPHNR